MRVSWFLPLAPLWTSVASSPTTNSPICPPTDGSTVVVTSGSAKYSMPVPANKTQFSLIGPEQQLGCVGPIARMYSMCLPCNFPANQVEVTPEAGICSFKISGRAAVLYNKHENGPLSITPPSQILEVECGLAQQNVLPPPPVMREDPGGAIDPALCHDGWWDSDTYQIIWLWSGDTKYIMNVWPSDAWYNVNPYGGNRTTGIIQVGCGVAPANHAVIGIHECLLCDIMFDKVRYDGQWGGRCEFDIGGRLTEVNTTSDDSQASSFVGGPGQVRRVRCKIDRYIDPLSTPPATIEDTADTDGTNDAKVPASTNPNCAASIDWKVAINAADGQTYLAPVPRDNQFHPSPEMHCVRLVDAACVPCNQIGPVVGVSTKVKWGPCIFFFYDRAGVNTPCLNENPSNPTSQVGPIVWFGPAGTISGIECGTA